MIRWILQGLIRDKTRSLFPFLIVAVGVALTVSLFGFMDGIGLSMLDLTAKLDTGHVRLVNKAFYEEEHLVPIDRALAGQKETAEWLERNSDPRIHWSPRIRWRALMDVPDENGETRSQTPVTGFAIDMLSPESFDVDRLNLRQSILSGRLPKNPHEMIVGYRLAENLDLKIEMSGGIRDDESLERVLTRMLDADEPGLICVPCGEVPSIWDLVKRPPSQGTVAR